MFLEISAFLSFGGKASHLHNETCTNRRYLRNRRRPFQTTSSVDNVKDSNDRVENGHHAQGRRHLQNRRHKFVVVVLVLVVVVVVVVVLVVVLLRTTVDSLCNGSAIFMAF